MNNKINIIIQESLDKIRDEYINNIQLNDNFWVGLNGKIEMLSLIANDNRLEVNHDLLNEIQNTRNVINRHNLNIL